MKKIAFLCDSSADISKEEAEELSIHVIRMPIIIDGVSYTEAETISDHAIIVALNANKKVTTTQPSLGEILAMWRSYFSGCGGVGWNVENTSLINSGTRWD